MKKLGEIALCFYKFYTHNTFRVNKPYLVYNIQWFVCLALKWLINLQGLSKQLVLPFLNGQGIKKGLLLIRTKKSEIYNIMRNKSIRWKSPGRFKIVRGRMNFEGLCGYNSEYRGRDLSRIYMPLFGFAFERCVCLLWFTCGKCARHVLRLPIFKRITFQNRNVTHNGTRRGFDSLWTATEWTRQNKKIRNKNYFLKIFTNEL